MTEPKTYQVVSAYTGEVKDTKDTRGQAEAIKASYDRQGDWSWRVRVAPR